MIGQLIPKRHIFNIIGCVCNEPTLAIHEDYRLDTEDFGEQFYKIIYATINNIVVNSPDIEKITAIDVDNMIAQSTKAYAIFTTNNGFEYIESAIESCNLKLFKHNFDNIKKYSLLRDCIDKGFSISHIYDYESTDLNKQAKQLDELEKMTVDDILNKLTTSFTKLQTKWSMGESKKSYTADFEIDSLMGKLKNKKEFGYPFPNQYYNAIFNGMREGGFMVRSMGTGGGKTRMALKEMAYVSAIERFNLDTNCWEKNPNPLASSMISTELEIEELQTIIIAIISGIPEAIVKSGTYTSQIEERIIKAINIIKESKMLLHYIDDFSVEDIELILKKDILEHNVKHLWFDYIQNVPKLSRAMQDAYGMSLRPDEILVNFASRLKLLANKYKCYISSSTQINRGAKDENNRDASGLRGSKQ